VNNCAKMARCEDKQSSPEDNARQRTARAFNPHRRISYRSRSIRAPFSRQAGREWQRAIIKSRTRDEYDNDANSRAAYATAASRDETQRVRGFREPRSRARSETVLSRSDAGEDSGCRTRSLLIGGYDGAAKFRVRGASGRSRVSI